MRQIKSLRRERREKKKKRETANLRSTERKKAKAGRKKKKTGNRGRLLGAAFGVLALDFLGTQGRIETLAALRGAFGVAGLALLADHDVQKCLVGNGKLTHKNNSPVS